MLDAFKRLLDGAPFPLAIDWFTADGDMGSSALQTAGFAVVKVVHKPSANPTVIDTQTAVDKFLAAGVDLVLFCGGDGTARDICSVTDEKTPVLGIPAGVKMYSGVFGITPAHTAKLLLRYLTKEIGLARVEIVDLDEDKYLRRRPVGGAALHVSPNTLRACLCAGREGAHHRAG